MNRALTALLALAILLPSLGCAMCASPYDYCAPTFTGNGHGDPCFINQRAGSILDPAPVAMPAHYQYDYADEYGYEQGAYDDDYDYDDGVIESPSDFDDQPYYEYDEPDPPPALRPQSETRLRPTPDRGVSVPRAAGGHHARVSHNSFRR